MPLELNVLLLNESTAAKATPEDHTDEGNYVKAESKVTAVGTQSGETLVNSISRKLARRNVTEGTSKAKLLKEDSVGLTAVQRFDLNSRKPGFDLRGRPRRHTGQSDYLLKSLCAVSLQAVYLTFAPAASWWQ